MPRLTRLLFALALTLVLGCLGLTVWSFASIQLRLSRNQPIAERIQNSLAPQFPGVGLRAAASYERDLIAVTTTERLPDTDLARIQALLKEFKDREQLSVGILLVTPRPSGGEPIESSI